MLLMFAACSWTLASDCLGLTALHPHSLLLQVWQLRGRYPNRGYPKIFNDAAVGAEAKKLFEEAQTMLQDFIAHKRVRLNGIAGIYPANAVGDDIEVYEEEARSEVKCKFFGLRQQAEKEGDEPYMCVSDFIAPKGSGVGDYLGLFACSAGHGLEKVVEGYKAAGDDYSYIMAEALADRLAEAFAEKMHELVRKELWGYAPEEKLTVDDMLKVKYQVRALTRYLQMWDKSIGLHEKWPCRLAQPPAACCVPLTSACDWRYKQLSYKTPPCSACDKHNGWCGL